MLRSVFLVSFLASPVFGGACSNYNSQSWIAAAGHDCYTSYVYTANLTTQDYCWDDINFTLQTHVTLANPSTMRQGDSVGDAERGTKNCGLNETNIVYCQACCMDKDIQDALVQASMKISDSSHSIWQAAKAAMTKLGKSDWPLLMIPFEQHSEIDYQYYDDMNFCVMDILFFLPPGDYYPGWPYRSFFITHKTVPTQ